MNVRTARARRASQESDTVIRWEFTRGHDRVVCQIERESTPARDARFAVAVLPFQNLQHATRENFDAVAAALRCHAALALDLRAAGWKLSAYTG
jgi:hypothetical protein